MNMMQEKQELKLQKQSPARNKSTIFLIIFRKNLLTYSYYFYIKISNFVRKSILHRKIF